MTTDMETFPIKRGCPFHPPEQYGAMRDAEGLQQVRLWNGQVAWVFTKYEEVRAVLADNRFSGDPVKPGFPSLSAARDAVLYADPTFIRMDPPDHGRLRRMLTREFMVKKIAEMRPRIEEIYDGLIDGLIARGNHAELTEELFLPFTSTVIADMLDVPTEDHGFFQEQSRNRVLLDADPAIPAEADRKIRAYMDKLVTEREKDPEGRTDIISRLIVDQLRHGHATHREIVLMSDLLLMAGHETTANQMALGVHSFLIDPKQRALLESDPTMVRGAVEEMLRFHTIVHYNAFRVAAEDVVFNGQTIRKGEAVIALIGAANRDPRAFEQPDVFDITRKADHHVAGSFGIHQCLGQPLARTELSTVFSTIFKRLPNLRLAVPAEEIKTKGDHFVLGLEKLPVVWG